MKPKKLLATTGLWFSAFAALLVLPASSQEVLNVFTPPLTLAAVSPSGGYGLVENMTKGHISGIVETGNKRFHPLPNDTLQSGWFGKSWAGDLGPTIFVERKNDGKSLAWGKWSNYRLRITDRVKFSGYVGYSPTTFSINPSGNRVAFGIIPKDAEDRKLFIMSRGQHHSSIRCSQIPGDLRSVAWSAEDELMATTRISGFDASHNYWGIFRTYRILLDKNRISAQPIRQDVTKVISDLTSMRLSSGGLLGIEVNKNDRWLVSITRDGRTVTKIQNLESTKPCFLGDAGGRYSLIWSPLPAGGYRIWKFDKQTKRVSGPSSISSSCAPKIDTKGRIWALTEERKLAQFPF